MKHPLPPEFIAFWQEVVINHRGEISTSLLSLMKCWDGGHHVPGYADSTPRDKRPQGWFLGNLISIAPKHPIKWINPPTTTH